MNVLTVVCHPRTTSLTFAVARQFVDGLTAGGNQTEVLDLHRSGFDPVLREVDEPNWSEEAQTFSKEVEDEIERMRRHDALAFVFPVWWWGMPAMLKGYIDRVWNFGWAYGGHSLPHRRVVWLALAGSGREAFIEWGFDREMVHYFDVCLARYCGIADSRVEVLYETTADAKLGTALDPVRAEAMLRRAYDLGLRFAD